MSSKGFRRFMMICLWIVLAFMYIPIIAIIAMSFNATAYGLFPYVFTTKWYTALFTTSNLLPAAWQSIKFAVLVAVSALLIGTMTSYGLQYLAPKTAARLNGLLRLPVIIPWLVMSVSLLLLFNFIGSGRSYFTMYLGNLMVVLPYPSSSIFPSIAFMRRSFCPGVRIYLSSYLLKLSAYFIFQVSFTLLGRCYTANLKRTLNRDKILKDPERS